MMDERDVWDRIGESDPYCGTGGPTRALPRIGKFAKPDTALLTMVGNEQMVLDIGCGYGRNSIPIFNRNHNTLACDVSLSMSQTVRMAKIPFILCDIHHLPFRDKSIDCLVCSHVLQHVRRKEIGLILAELRRIAKRSLIVMPNPIGIASFLGLKSALHFLAMSGDRHGRRLSEDIPAFRGYVVNYYLPWVFSSLMKRFFRNVEMAPGIETEKLPPYLTNSLVYICS